MTAISHINARDKKAPVRREGLNCYPGRINHCRRGASNVALQMRLSKTWEDYIPLPYFFTSIKFWHYPTISCCYRRSFQAVGISAYQIIAFRNTLLTIVNQLRPLRGGINSVNVTCKGADLPSVGDWLLITGLGKVKSRGVTNSLSLDELWR